MKRFVSSILFGTSMFSFGFSIARGWWPVPLTTAQAAAQPAVGATPAEAVAAQPFVQREFSLHLPPRMRVHTVWCYRDTILVYPDGKRYPIGTRAEFHLV